MMAVGEPCENHPGCTVGDSPLIFYWMILGGREIAIHEGPGMEKKACLNEQ